MKFIIALLIAAATLSACAGLDITSISPDRVTCSHASRSNVPSAVATPSTAVRAACAKAYGPGGAKLRGYVVYEPAIMVKIGCNTTTDTCDPENGNICEVGDPFMVPDLNSPFLLNTRAGLGNAGITLTITDGWRLDQIQNNTNNTQLLDLLKTTLQPLVNAAMQAPPPSTSTEMHCSDSIYRVELDGGKLILQRVTLEPTK